VEGNRLRIPGRQAQTRATLGSMKVHIVGLLIEAGFDVRLEDGGEGREEGKGNLQVISIGEIELRVISLMILATTTL